MNPAMQMQPMPMMNNMMPMMMNPMMNGMMPMMNGMNPMMGGMNPMMGGMMPMMGGLGAGPGSNERETDRQYDVAFESDDDTWNSGDGAPAALGRPERRPR